jgi:diaminopimelate decarboxylase
MTTQAPFGYRGGRWCAEQVAIEDMAASVGTPFYCYSTLALTERYQAFAAALAGLDAHIRYALKANANLAVVRTLAALGAGADVVSEGELRIALAAGIGPEKIIFAGVGKTESEIAFALAAGIEQFNVESEPELMALSKIASAQNRRAAIALRVNPAIETGTHAKISTGHEATKFGIPWRDAQSMFERAAKLDGIEIKGVHVHIGSQINELAPFEAAFAKVAELAAALRASGHPVARIDLGGGLGIPDGAPNLAGPNLRSYGDLVRRHFGQMKVKLLFEPGRLLVAEAGILVTRALYIKRAEQKTYVIVDAAMNDFLRPTLYDAVHRVVPVQEPAKSAPTVAVDVVGPVCETGDFLARGQQLSAVAAGDLLAVLDTGAYGAVMASTYNARPLAPEVLVKGDRFAVVRRRPTYDEMLRLESLPDWLAGREARP